jgi:hypothetical protein
MGGLWWMTISKMHWLCTCGMRKTFQREGAQGKQSFINTLIGFLRIVHNFLLNTVISIGGLVLLLCYTTCKSFLLDFLIGRTFLQDHSLLLAWRLFPKFGDSSCNSRRVQHTNLINWPF